MGDEGLVVLSLFDGIACGRLALERAGVKVRAYYASEIDPRPAAIAARNWPDIARLGDVRKVEWRPREGLLRSEKGEYAVPGGKIDLLMGDSPCTDFSNAGKKKGMASEGGEILTLEGYLELKKRGARMEGQSYLFWEYVRVLRETSPRNFLLENVVMAERWRDAVTEALGAEPVEIDSALVSAQRRRRLYWTDITPLPRSPRSPRSPLPSRSLLPPDRGVKLDDIVCDSACGEGDGDRDLMGLVTVQKALPVLVGKYGGVPPKFSPYGRRAVGDKCGPLLVKNIVTSRSATLMFRPSPRGPHSVKGGVLDGEWPAAGAFPDGRYILRHFNVTELERLRTLPDGYVEDAARTEGVGLTAMRAAIGNCWTVDVIAHLLGPLKTSGLQGPSRPRPGRRRRRRSCQAVSTPAC